MPASGVSAPPFKGSWSCSIKVLAAFASTSTRIRGVGFIRAKESDRLGDLCTELRALVADPQARQPQAALEAAEVYAAIAALPDDFRDVLVAVDITGLSYSEAARALRIREGTVMSRLYRARQQVVRRVEGGGA